MIKFVEETHQYFVNDKEIPCVSDILSEVLAEDFSQVPADLLQRATDWGTAVHKQTQLSEWGLIDMKALQPILAKSIEAWQGWVEDYEVLDIEKAYYHDLFNYCGTIDRVLRHRESGQIVICDIKTSSSLKRKYGLQLSAYGELYCHNNNVAWDDIVLMAVQIDQHGNLKTKVYKDEWLTFKSFLDVYEWKNRFKRKK